MTTLPVTFDHDKLVDALRQIEPRVCVLLGFACAEPISRTVILGAAVEAHHIPDKPVDRKTLRRVR